jgi:hypothetical protein
LFDDTALVLMSTPLPPVHRDLVEALEGDATGTGIESAEWSEKVRHALPIDDDVEAQRALGRKIAEGTLRSVVGRALALSLELVHAERVWATIVSVVSSRLRCDVTVSWRLLAPGQGTLTLGGRRATPPHVSLGAMEAFGARTQPRTEVRIAFVSEERLDFEMRWPVT